MTESDSPTPPLAPSPVEAPVLPTPVTLAPCPAAWTEVAPARPSGATTCSPGDAPWVGCEPGQARLPGEAACRPLSDCDATDGFPASAPTAGDVRFVRAGASGGDGSRASPFGALDEALVGATDGTTVVLSSGTHVGGVASTAAITLLGVCAGETFVTGPASAPALQLTGANSRVERVSLRAGGGAQALAVAAGANTALFFVEVDGPLVIDGTLTGDDISLRGGLVQVTGTLEASRVHGAGARVDVSGALTLSSSALLSGELAVSVGEGGEVNLNVVVIADFDDRALSASGDGARASLTDVLVSDIDDEAGLGTGLDVWNGARLTATRVHVAGTGAATLEVSGDGTEAELTSVVLSAAGRGSTSSGHPSLVINDGAYLSATGVSVEATRGFGVLIFDAAADFEDLTILDTTNGMVPGQDGVGLTTSFSNVSVLRGLARGAATIGVFASDHSQLRLEDVTIADTRPAMVKFGRGLNVQSGAKVVLARVAIEDTHEDGLFVEGRGVVVTGTDLRVSGTRVAQGGPLVGMGIGIHIQTEGLVELRRVEVSDTPGFGIVVLGEGTRARLRDVVVRDTMPWELEPIGGSRVGRGIDVQPGGVLELERALIERSHDVGLFVSNDCTATLLDVTVRGTFSNDADGSSGSGITIRERAAVTGRRLLVEDNREVGIVTYGGAVDIEDVVIRGTRATSCTTEGCPTAGIGLGAYRSATVSARRFLIDGNALAGVQVAEGGGLDLERGTVSGSPIGASLQVRDYDISRLSDRVRYEDNGTNLDSTSLPVPQPSATFMSMGES